MDETDVTARAKRVLTAGVDQPARINGDRPFRDVVPIVGWRHVDTDELGRLFAGDPPGGLAGSEATLVQVDVSHHPDAYGVLYGAPGGIPTGLFDLAEHSSGNRYVIAALFHTPHPDHRFDRGEDPHLAFALDPDEHADLLGALIDAGVLVVSAEAPAAGRDSRGGTAVVPFRSGALAERVLEAADGQ